DYTDVSYLMKTANLPVFLQVRNDSKFKTLSDMITYMKDTNNVPVTIGTIGVGTAGHLAMEKIRKDFGISNYTNIPFKSTADAWNGLTQGGVDAILCATDIDVDFLRLATASSKRSTLYPDVPTFTEMGYPMNIGTTNVLVTDKDVPQEIQDVLIDAFTKAMNDPETIATFKKVGIDLDFQNAADTKKMVEEELSWGPDMLKDLGLYVNDPHQK
ncbi:MAG: tripartite tricarboxylate transporter substrate-binding protein, partial [Oscillospiraceae bacterium]